MIFLFFSRWARPLSLEELSLKILKVAEQASKKTELPVATVVCEPSTEDLAAIPRGQSLQKQVLQEQAPKIKKYRILSISSNRISKKRDPTAHSEILALQEACRRKKNERLTGCIMLTTLEPCLMCSGAIILARLESVYYFAPTHKGPGMTWVLQQISKKNYSLKNKEESARLIFNHYPSLFHLKEREEQYQKLLRSFFKVRRKSEPL